MTTPLDGPLGLVRDSFAPGRIAQLASHAAAWDAFADHHGLDRDDPRDHELVAYVQARAAAGISYLSIHQSISAVRLAVEHTSRLDHGSRLTVPALRHLSDLLADGTFSASAQAPPLTLGKTAAIISATVVHPDQLIGARDQLAALACYLGPLRLDELHWPDLEHVAATRRGTVRLLLPRTKTDVWVYVELQPVHGLPGPVEVLDRYLELRGDEPGPLMVSGPDLSRAATKTLDYGLKRAAARAGIAAFSSYSLRRSWAIHAELAGTPPEQIRHGLRHTDGSSTYRRYIEPLHALMDREAAITHFLDPAIPETDPILIEEVSSGRRRAPELAFAHGSIDELLQDIDLTQLRVPRQLTFLQRTTIERAKATFRRWARWANIQNIDPFGPGPYDLTRWVHKLFDLELHPRTVLNYLDQVRTGWAAATDSDEPPAGFDFAMQFVEGALQDAPATGYVSRCATDADLTAVLAQLPTPDASDDPQHIARTLRNRMLVCVLAASGGRPKDLATAYLDGLEVHPSGALLPLIAAKGQRPATSGRLRILWMPTTEDHTDALTAIRSWQAWTGNTDGPLVPAISEHQAVLDGTARQLTARQVSALVTKLIREAGINDGLTAYGFRYRRAQQMHDAGASFDAIAEALGHAHANTAAGYVQNIDHSTVGLQPEHVAAIVARVSEREVGL